MPTLPAFCWLAGASPAGAKKKMLDKVRAVPIIGVMENTMKMVKNSKGKRIAVDARGWTYCDDCGGEFQPDDMAGDKLCLTCHDDLHADDWTMEDC